jgi:hypothetical protein
MTDNSAILNRLSFEMGLQLLIIGRGPSPRRRWLRDALRSRLYGVGVLINAHLSSSRKFGVWAH